MRAIGVTQYGTRGDTAFGGSFERRVGRIATSTTFMDNRAVKNFHLPLFNSFPFINPTVESLTPSAISCEFHNKHWFHKYT